MILDNWSLYCSFLVIDDDENDDTWQSGEFTNDCVIQQGLVRRARMASFCPTRVAEEELCDLNREEDTLQFVICLRRSLQR